jgi:hypothetical protein
MYIHTLLIYYQQSNNFITKVLKYDLVVLIKKPVKKQHLIIN